MATKYAPQYAAGGDKALIDFLNGSPDFRTGEWQGYEGIDLNATIDLGETEMVKNVSINFLQDENSWIFMPDQVEFYSSTDGNKFNLFKTIKTKHNWKDSGNIIETFSADLNKNIRHLRIIGRNQGDCPRGHKSAGGKCWIFADEITIK